jgi:hypothetical protein
VSIRDYIQGKFQSMSITLCEAELLELSINGGLTMSSDVTASNIADVARAIAGFIPGLLLRPSSVSEGGFSTSFDKDALMKYHAYLCSTYDLPNTLTGIQDGTDLW